MARSKETIRITTAEGKELDAAEPQSYRHLFTPTSFLFLYSTNETDYRLAFENKDASLSVGIMGSSDGPDTYEQLYQTAEQLLGFKLDRFALTVYKYELERESS